MGIIRTTSVRGCSGPVGSNATLDIDSCIQHFFRKNLVASVLRRAVVNLCTLTTCKLPLREQCMITAFFMYIKLQIKQTC